MLTWGDRLPEHTSGIDRGVIYAPDGQVVVWNGLISVEEDEDGADVSITYVDGAKMTNRLSLGSFVGSIEAITYPNILDEVVGPSYFAQPPKTVDFCYRTKTAAGYQLHLVYNALLSEDTSTATTINDSVEVGLFRWGVTTLPVAVSAVSLYEHIPITPTAHLIIDSDGVSSESLRQIESVLYGSESGLEPYFPNPTQVVDILEASALFQIIDLGDGIFQAMGSDEAVRQIDSTTWELSWPSVIQLDAVTYQASTF